MSRCTALRETAGRTVIRSFRPAVAPRRTPGRPWQRRQHGQRRQRRQRNRNWRLLGIVMNPSSTYTQNASSTAAFPYPARARAPQLHLPDLQHRHRRDRLHKTGRRSSSSEWDGHPTRERERHGVRGDRLRDADRRLHERQGDVRRALERTPRRTPRTKNDGLMTCGTPVGAGSCSGSATSATDGDEDMAYALLMAEQAVERRQLFGGRDDADREHLLA